MPLTQPRRAVRFGTQRAVLAAVAGFIVAVVAYLAPNVTFIPVVALVTAISFGWPLLFGSDLHEAHVVVVLIPGLTAVLVAVLTNYSVRWLTVTVAGGVILAFVSGLARWGKEPSPVETAAGLVCGQLAVVSGAGWILVTKLSTTAELPLLGALCLAIAAISVVARLPVLAGLFAAITVGALVGWASAFVLPAIPAWVGAVIGAFVGGSVAIVQALVDGSPHLKAGGASVAAALVPVSVTGLVLFAVGRTLLG